MLLDLKVNQYRSSYVDEENDIWPLYNSQGVVKASSENISSKKLSQTSHSLQQRAEISECAVQLPTISLRCDVQPTSYRQKQPQAHSVNLIFIKEISMSICWKYVKKKN